MAMNHASITGPKNRPIAPVPRCWIAKRASVMTKVMGTTAMLNFSSARVMPSTAERIEIAGVMTASP